MHRLPLKDGCCVMKVRYFQSDWRHLMVVGNAKSSPFLRIFALANDWSNRPAEVIYDMNLSEVHGSMFRRVIFADDEHLLVEKISETGVFI